MRGAAFKMAVLAAGLMLAGCAGTTQFQSYPGLNAARGTAVVHVVRANAAWAAAESAPVYVDRYLIGRIGPGGRVSTPVPVGQVHVTSMAADTIINAQSGGEYFFEVSSSAREPFFDVAPISRERAQEIAGRIP